jgi:hypothetical protein
VGSSSQNDRMNLFVEMFTQEGKVDLHRLSEMLYTFLYSTLSSQLLAVYVCSVCFLFKNRQYCIAEREMKLAGVGPKRIYDAFAINWQQNRFCQSLRLKSSASKLQHISVAESII